MLMNLFYETYFDANFEKICKLEPAVEVQFSWLGSDQIEWPNKLVRLLEKLNLSSHQLYCLLGCLLGCFILISEGI
jgi:hypothetical protein